MPWVKIDDQFHSNPKVVAAGSDAISLYIVALSWCGGYLTDGFIPTAQVRRLALCDDYETAAQRLVDVGLWHRVDGGYEVNDYLEYNPSGEEIKAKRKAAAERQAAWRERHTDDEDAEEDDDCDEMESNAVSNGVTNDVTNTTSRTRPHARTHTNTHATDASSKAGNSRPPAVNVFRENAHRFPAKSWWKEVDTVVGRAPPHLELWGKDVKAYVGNGWNPVNVRNMLKFFKEGTIPPAGGGSNGDSTQSKSMEAIEQWGV